MEIKQLDLKNLSSAELEYYQALIPEDKRFFIHLEKNKEDLTGFGAFDNNKLIGLLLALITSYAELKSLFVEEKWRNQSVATHLLSAFSTFLYEKECHTATVLFDKENPYSKIFESILKKLGWMAPVPLIHRYFFDGAAFNPAWLYPLYTPPSSLSTSSPFTLFLWKDLTPSERELLLKKQREGRFQGEISPFIHEAAIEPLNSLGLKDEKGEIIGWMINHRLNPTTIRYSALYINPKYRLQLNPVQLLIIETTRIQKELIRQGHPAVLAVFDLNLNQTSSKWQRFVERRIKPHATKVTPIYMSWKSFNR